MKLMKHLLHSIFMAMQHNVITMVEILSDCSACVRQQRLKFDCQIAYGYYIGGIWQL